MNEQVVCFLPCRSGSERVPKKNIRPFSRFRQGLIELKLGQLLEASRIEEVVLSTNDPAIIDYAERLEAPRLSVHVRDDALASSATRTDELIAHAADILPERHILWTHVTSPFVTAEVYDEAVAAYFGALEEGRDSLMSTTPLHEFLWTQDGPINYDREVERWPRTQTLTPVHEVNSAVFLAHRRIYDRLGDRVGERPLLWPMNRITAMDIDWEEDFILAEQMLERGLASA